MAKKIFDKPPEDRLFFFLKTLLKTFNPEKYHDLSARPMTSSVKYFLGIILISSLILGVLIGINMVSLHATLDNELAKLDTLKVSCSFSEPIVFGKQNIVIANDMNYTGQNILITSSEIQRKPLSCMLLRPLCLFNSKPVTTDYTNLGKDPKGLGDFLYLALVLMFPGILLGYLLFMMVKSLLIIYMLSIIAYVLIRAFKLKMRFRQILLCALYSSTILLLAEPFNIMLINLHYIHVALFILLFTISILLISERKYRYQNA